MNLLKNNLSFILIGIVSLLLGALAILTAVKLRQEQPVTPTVPQTKPKALEGEPVAACTNTFSLVFPSPTPEASPDTSCKLIDFESIPGGAPTAGMQISNQFEQSTGVSFRLESLPNKTCPYSFPELAGYGPPLESFGYPNGPNAQPDTLRPGENGGSFFLVLKRDTTPGQGNLNIQASYNCKLVINYTSPVQTARFAMTDVDRDAINSEHWGFTAYNSSGSQVLQQDLVGTAARDGALSYINFTSSSQNISRIELTNLSTVTGGFGFDNFSPNCIETPVCGNGSIETGEQCDDGNTVDGDGCSNTCQIEIAATPTPSPTPRATPVATATPSPTPAATPIPNQCQQYAIYRDNVLINMKDIRLGDTIRFRGFAIGDNVTHLRFTLYINGVAQPSVDVPAVALGNNSYYADYVVTITTSGSYRISILTLP